MPNFPANEAKGSHTVPFARTIFIEQSDFREVRRGGTLSSLCAALFLGGFPTEDDGRPSLLFAGDGEGLQAFDPGAACGTEACWVRHLLPEGHQGEAPRNHEVWCVFSVLFFSYISISSCKSSSIQPDHKVKMALIYDVSDPFGGCLPVLVPLTLLCFLRTLGVKWWSWR